jgi:hypothetical protein
LPVTGGKSCRPTGKGCRAIPTENYRSTLKILIYLMIFKRLELARSLLNEKRVRLQEATRAERHIRSSIKRRFSEHAAEIYAVGG